MLVLVEKACAHEVVYVEGRRLPAELGSWCGRRYACCWLMQVHAVYESILDVDQFAVHVLESQVGYGWVGGWGQLLTVFTSLTRSVA
jgi:hypothetical protein